MSYTSLNFALFVCITALVYFLFPVKKYQWTVLLAASYVFYLFVGYKHAFFLLFTTVSVYATALVIDRIAVRGQEQLKAHKEDWDKAQKKAFRTQIKQKKRSVMLLAVIVNLAILCFLKYYNFLAGSLNDLLGAGGIRFSAPTLRLLLPLGISFYTFQAVGYVLDVYNEKVQPERNVFKFALFVSFFPQIVQGPISFYSQLAHQLYEPHRFEYTRAKHGCELILWGLFKKLVIADRALIAINAVLDQYINFGGTTLTFTILLYALQLYTDFSGGIDISRGVAQILGIDMVQNFKRPYFATDINDYWRRWHISLGAWMKEYVFYPLALSKRCAALSKKIKASRFGSTPAGNHVARVLPTSIASLIVFLLVGAWHGANWKYIGFGLWNGGVIMVSTLMEPLFVKLAEKLRINTKTMFFRLFQMLRTFLIVLVEYVFDVAPTLTDALRTLWRMLVRQNFAAAGAEIAGLGLTGKDYWLLGICTLFLLVVSILQERSADVSLREKLDQKPFILRYALLFVGILAIVIFGIYGPGYNPADFVYMQF